MHLPANAAAKQEATLNDLFKPPLDNRRAIIARVDEIHSQLGNSASVNDIMRAKRLLEALKKDLSSR